MNRRLFLALLLSYLLIIVIIGTTAMFFPSATTISILCAFAVACTVAAILAARITVPLKELRAGLRRITAGDLNVRITPSHSERLFDIAHLFNETVEHIGQLLADLQRQQAAFDAVLGSVHEALVVFNNEGRVTLANKSFRKLVGIDDIDGLLYWEILRDPGFISLIRGAGTECTQQNLEIAGRTYATSATRLNQTNEIVVSFHDITDIINAERLKKELVLNAAHELRTPLTAIRGYVETIEPIVDEEGRRCLAIIRRHTDRLARLVQDIATLAELEDPDLRLDVETIDLQETVAEVVQMFAVMAKTKQLDLTVERTDGPLYIKADRFRIEQVLMNLIDNAIRYTEKGSVTIKLARQDDSAVIKVADTGPGIEAHHLPRLFERFYVVDKSRSRQTGGTGLGLSIVRHIVLLHGGEVSVNSTVGVGTCFTVTLPISPVKTQDGTEAAQT